MNDIRNARAQNKRPGGLHTQQHILDNTFTNANSNNRVPVQRCYKRAIDSYTRINNFNNSTVIINYHSKKDRSKDKQQSLNESILAEAVDCGSLDEWSSSDEFSGASFSVQLED